MRTESLPSVFADAAFERAVDFVACVDEQGRFSHMSDAGLAFIGYHREYLRIIALADLVPAEEQATLAHCLAEARLSGEPRRCEVHLVKTLTYPRRVGLCAVPDGCAPGRLLLVGHDLSEWAERERVLAHALHHDGLTGLDNLVSLGRRVERAKREALDAGEQIALVGIDIEDFHRVNRSFGYEVGDLVLKEVAQRLRSVAYARDLVARGSGAAFRVLLRDVDGGREAAEQAARRIHDALMQPYSLQGQTLQLSVRMGAVLFPDPVNQAGPLLWHVDEAVVRARENGERLSFYERGPTGDSSDSLRLESDLHNAIRNGELSLHYQPIVRIGSREVVGLEALMRWQHPVLGAISPVVFIPIAEAAGLINFLGDWALRNTCMQLMQWDSQGIHIQYATVNVSAQQFRDSRFASSVRAAFALTGLSPQRIVLEITESVLMQDPDGAKRILEDLASTGVRFAVDDFGTGYSSLAYLQSFPLSTLKIDRRFIRELPVSRNDQAIVAAVAGLARTLGLELVAEGVETEAQCGMLVQSGCHLMQGWLVCKALPGETLAGMFRQGTLRTAGAPVPARGMQTP